VMEHRDGEAGRGREVVVTAAIVWESFWSLLSIGFNRVSMRDWCNLSRKAVFPMDPLPSVRSKTSR
jgi:hypothetical protein